MSEIIITKDSLQNAVLKDGQFAFGVSETNDSSIISSNYGAFAHGCVNTGGTLKASGIGSHAEGFAHENGEIIASGNGSFAIGAASIWESEGSGVIKAEYSGAFAGGLVNSYGKIIAKDAVGIAVGTAGTHGKILTEGVGDGKFALGTANSSGNIISTGEGAIARGMATENSSIIAESRGSYAGGYANDFSIIDASGYGAHAEGYVSESRVIIANGYGAHAEGTGTIAIGNGAHAEGTGADQTLIAPTYENQNGLQSSIIRDVNLGAKYVEIHSLKSDQTASNLNKVKLEVDYNFIIKINNNYYRIRRILQGSENGIRYARLFLDHMDGLDESMEDEERIYAILGGVAYGTCAHVSGNHNIACASNQTVIGTYNVPDPNALFIIGNGTDNMNRNNNFIIYDNGEISQNNILDVVGCPSNNDTDWTTKALTTTFIKYLNNNTSTYILETDDYIWYRYTNLGQPTVVIKQYYNNIKITQNDFWQSSVNLVFAAQICYNAFSTIYILSAGSQSVDIHSNGGSSDPHITLSGTSLDMAYCIYSGSSGATLTYFPNSNNRPEEGTDVYTSRMPVIRMT